MKSSQHFVGISQAFTRCSWLGPVPGFAPHVWPGIAGLVVDLAIWKNHGVKVSWEMLGVCFPSEWKITIQPCSSQHQPVMISGPFWIKDSQLPMVLEPDWRWRWSKEILEWVPTPHNHSKDLTVSVGGTKKAPWGYVPSRGYTFRFQHCFAWICNMKGFLRSYIWPAWSPKTRLETVWKLSLNFNAICKDWFRPRNEYVAQFPPLPLDGCTCLGGTTWPSGSTEFGQFPMGILASFKVPIWRWFKHTHALLLQSWQHYITSSHILGLKHSHTCHSRKRCVWKYLKIRYAWQWYAMMRFYGCPIFRQA